MNFKAIFLGVISTIAASIVGGTILDAYAGSREGFIWLAQHREWIYVSNGVAGFTGGWVTYALGRKRLFLNLLVMSTTVFVLSLITNLSIVGAITDIGALLTSLVVGWAAPFLFLLFAEPEAT